MEAQTGPIQTVTPTEATPSSTLPIVAFAIAVAALILAVTLPKLTVGMALAAAVGALILALGSNAQHRAVKQPTSLYSTAAVIAAVIAAIAAGYLLST